MQTAVSFVSLIFSSSRAKEGFEISWVMWDSPDQEGPVRVDNADPAFVQLVADLREESGVRVEILDRHLF